MASCVPSRGLLTGYPSLDHSILEHTPSHYNEIWNCGKPKLDNTEIQGAKAHL